MADAVPDFRVQADLMFLGLRFLADVDLAFILQTIERAHTLGPLLEPTAYRDALQRGDLQTVGQIARALQEPVRLFQDARAQLEL